MSDTQQSPLTPPDPAGPPWTPSPEPQRRRRRVGTVALVAGGLLAGGILGGTLSATASGGDAGAAAAVGEAGSAATDGSAAPDGAAAPNGSAVPTPPSGTCDEDTSQGPRSGETALEGDVADQVEAAALAEYPGATVLRVEKDADGVYEAHLVTADGEHLTVAVDEDFTVTGVEEGGGPGGMGDAPGGRGPGGPTGDADGRYAPDGQGDASASALTS